MTEKIRKFERFLMSCKSNKSFNEKDRVLIGTYVYDYENQTEKYIPAPKNKDKSK